MQYCMTCKLIPVPRARPPGSKKRSTRRALATAARDLVLQHGLESITVEQMAGVAGVSVRTFFNGFESKEVAIIGGDTPIGTEESHLFLAAARPATC